MIKRSEVLKGRTKKVKTGCGSLYITINDDETGNPFEVFVRLGKAGGCASSQTEALGRLITLCLKGGIPLSVIIQQLHGIGCHQPAGLGEAKNLSCADGVAKALELVNKNVKEKVDFGQELLETPVGGTSKQEAKALSVTRVDLGEGATPLPVPPTLVKKRVVENVANSTSDKKIVETPRLDFDKISKDVAKVLKDTDPRFWARQDEPKVRGRVFPIPSLSGACPECGASLVFEEGCEKCYSCGYTKC